MDEKHLIKLANDYAAHTGLSVATVSNKAVGHARLFKRLCDGLGCTLKTAKLALDWFTVNWPEDLEWPTDIPRPQKSKEEAA